MNNNEQPKMKEAIKQFVDKQKHLSSDEKYGFENDLKNFINSEEYRSVSHPQEPQVKSAEEMKINSNRVKGLTYFISSVPMALLNEVFAKEFHGQTLQRLNERGGMGVPEILANIKHDKSIAFKSETQDDINELCEIVEKHNRIAASQFKPEPTEELKEYKAACEQYHNSNLAWQETCLQKTNKIIELQREIEHLKSELEYWKKCYATMQQSYLIQREENEKLKSEPKAWIPPTDKWIEDRAMNAADAIGDEGMAHLAETYFNKGAKDMRDQYLNSQRKD